MIEVAKLTLEVWRCDQCGWKWFPRLDEQGKVKAAKRCPNPKCRKTANYGQREQESRVVGLSGRNEVEVAGVTDWDAAYKKIAKKAK